MTGDPLSDLRGVLSLLALLLWPGLVVVRSPGLVVPFLSASFWLLSWWWLPTGRERSSFLTSALVFFALLSLLRLLKPLPPLRPSLRTIGVCLLALLCLLPLAWLRVAPGLSLASLEARLVVWREGIPATYEPLLSIPSFGAHAPGFPFLVADMALLSGQEPYRAALLLSLAASSLFAVAVFALLDRAARPRLGLAMAAAVMLATVLGARAAFAQPGPAALAGGLGLVAWGLLVRGSGRSPAVAGGALLAAALTVQGLVALPIAVAAGFTGPKPRRLLALSVGLLLAAPRLWLTLPAVSLDEVRLGLLPGLGAVLPRREPMPDEDAWVAMAWVRDHMGPLDHVCASPGSPARWLPALVGRSVVPGEIPWLYRDEASAPAPSCRFTMVFAPFDPSRHSLDPAHPRFDPAPPHVAFEMRTVRVMEPATAEDSVTSFDTGEGNPRPRQP